MTGVNTKEELNDIVAVELFGQAVDGRETYFDQSRGVFPLVKGDIELSDPLTSKFTGNVSYFIHRNPQLRKRLENEYGLREPGYDYFDYLTQEQLEKRIVEIENKAKMLNDTLKRIKAMTNQE